jgi:hypothetical protein
LKKNAGGKVYQWSSKTIGVGGKVYQYRSKKWCRWKSVPVQFKKLAQVEKCNSTVQKNGHSVPVYLNKMGVGEKVYQHHCVILLRGEMAFHASAQTQYGGSIKILYCHNNKYHTKIAPQSIQYNQKL